MENKREEQDIRLGNFVDELDLLYKKYALQILGTLRVAFNEEKKGALGAFATFRDDGTWVVRN